MSAVVFQLRELLYLSRGLRAYARRRTPRVRKVFAWLLRAMKLPKYLQRRRLVRDLPVAPGFAISEETGIINLTGFEPEVLEQAVAEGKRVFDTIDLSAERAKAPDLHRFDFPLRDHLTPDNPILRLALHPKLIRIVSEYIGMIPVIENITLWYSPNDHNVEGSSQYYHLDGQDLRTVQVFIFLGDVTEDSGPLTAVAAAASENLAQIVAYRKNERTRRISDELVLSRVAPEREIYMLVGPESSAYAVDTDRCFHYGSRAGRRSRRLLLIQYYSPFAFVLPWDWSTDLPLAHLAEKPGFGDIERLVLGAV